MEITLKDTGKKFIAEWIFRKLNYTFSEGNKYAILGKNGSGKSTLLQVIAGNLHPTTGTVSYRHNGKEIPDEKIFHHLSLTAPYQELIEDFTVEEMIRFHFLFKDILPGFDQKKLLEMLGFRIIRHKPIRSFSSGMKQRVKLLLSVMSDVPLLLLDEPTMNLDRTGSEWYLELIRQYAKDRMVIVCSNLEQQETSFCNEKIIIEDFK